MVDKLLFLEIIFKKSQIIIKVEDVNFYLSPKIGMFDTFLLNNKSDASFYIKKRKEVIDDYYKRISDSE